MHTCRIDLPPGCCTVPFVESTARKKKEAEGLAVLRACAELDHANELRGAMQSVSADMLRTLTSGAASQSPASGEEVEDPLPPTGAPPSCSRISATHQGDGKSDAIAPLAPASAATAAAAAPVTRHLDGAWFSEAPKQFFFNAFQNNRWAHPVYTTVWTKERKSYQCSVPLPAAVSVATTGRVGAQAKGESGDRKVAEAYAALCGCRILDALGNLCNTQKRVKGCRFASSHKNSLL